MLVFGVLLEGFELVIPKGLDFFKPIPQLGEFFSPQAIDSHSRVVLETGFFYQPASAQDAQVPAHRGGAHLECDSEITGALRGLIATLTRDNEIQIDP